MGQAGVAFVSIYLYILMGGSGEGLKLGDYDEGAVKVYTVRLGEGCREGCVQCGAYPEEPARGDYLIKEVTRARIWECLTREFVFEPVRTDNPKFSRSQEVLSEKSEEVRNKIADLLANYVTTDVNQEPLNGDVFIHFAELVKQLTGGNSRAVCISHGLRVKKVEKDGDKVEVTTDEKATGRLGAMANMMDDKDVFVLSLDVSRSKGRINDELSLWSYAETLNRLLPALRKGARITVFIQGNDNRDSRQHRVGAENLYGRVKKLLIDHYRWKQADIMELHMDTGRAWVRQGRAANLPGVDPDGESPVIPDSSFVEHTLDKEPPNMGFLDAVSGKVFVHPHNPRRSYNDVVRLSRWLSERGRLGIRKGAWIEVETSGEIENLNEHFSREARLETLAKLKNSKRVEKAGR